MSLTAQRSAPVATTCSHCGDAVPSGRLDSGSTTQFCCDACATVYAAIHAHGLDAFYTLRARELEVAPQPELGVGDFLTFDDPAFAERYVHPAPGGRLRIELYLDGVHCGACLWLVERLPRIVDGVTSCRLDLARQVAQVVWDPQTTAPSRIAAALQGLGYRPHPYAEDQRARLRRREARGHLIRIGIAGACAGNVMLIAFALYGGALEGMEPIYRNFFRSVALGLTLIALAGPGRVFLRGAWTSLRTGVLHMDVPVAIALVAGTAWGAWNTWSGRGEVYFESLTAVIFLLLIGRWMQHRQQRDAQDAVSLLFALTPSRARRVDADGCREVRVEALQPGDLIEVGPGEEVPVDGTIAEGASDVDLSLLTGESVPVRRLPGQPLHAGTVNVSAPLRLRCEATGAATRVGQMMETVERHAREKPPLVRLADRVAHLFVLVVLALALATLVGWWSAGPGIALEHAIALLIVTCPCALGLATPLALLVAIGRAAGVGILIKGGEVIERLAQPGQIWLDKTGTLTEGTLRVAEWVGEPRWGGWAAALERGAEHPVARAIRHRFADGADEVTDVQAVPGCGVEGRIDGQRVCLGAPRWIRASSVAPPAAIEQATERAACRGASTVWLAVDGTVVGAAVLEDRLREDAAAAVQALQAEGWEVGMISGDRASIAAGVATRLGIDPQRVHGDVLPERKAAMVQQVLDRGGRRPLFGRDRPVVMVGDGVNDAAALAAADVGVAVRGGAQASLSAADVYLQHGGLERLVELIRGSRRTVSVIRRNVAISLAYNGLAAGLAIAGWIDPMIAAVLMPISSLSVVGLSYRSTSFLAPVDRSVHGLSRSNAGRSGSGKPGRAAAAPQPLAGAAR